jgi:hypothetical protein
MAWIYLAESAESATPLENTCDLSPIVKSTPIVKQSCSLEWQVEILEKPQSVPISGIYKYHLRSIVVSISFMGGFPVKTSALQAMEKAWRESEAAFIGKSIAWPKKSSPSSYSWKMFHVLAVGGLGTWPPRLPKSGMTVDGRLYPLKSLEHLTKEKDGGCWRAQIWIKLLPTPQACDSNKGPAKEYIPNGKQSSMRNLVTIVARFSTTGKKLNPPFVEWMMGLPIGWSELSVWAMEWYHNARKKRLSI